eukprot:gene25781-32273_t
MTTYTSEVVPVELEVLLLLAKKEGVNVVWDALSTSEDKKEGLNSLLTRATLFHSLRKLSWDVEMHMKKSSVTVFTHPLSRQKVDIQFAYCEEVLDWCFASAVFSAQNNKFVNITQLEASVVLQLAPPPVSARKEDAPPAVEVSSEPAVSVTAGQEPAAVSPSKQQVQTAPPVEAIPAPTQTTTSTEPATEPSVVAPPVTTPLPEVTPAPVAPVSSLSAAKAFLAASKGAPAVTETATEVATTTTPVVETPTITTTPQIESQSPSDTTASPTKTALNVSESQEAFEEYSQDNVTEDEAAVAVSSAKNAPVETDSKPVSESVAQSKAPTPRIETAAENTIQPAAQTPPPATSPVVSHPVGVAESSAASSLTGTAPASAAASWISVSKPPVDTPTSARHTARGDGSDTGRESVHSVHSMSGKGGDATPHGGATVASVVLTDAERAEQEAALEIKEREGLDYQTKDLVFSSIIIEGEALEHATYDTVMANLTVEDKNYTATVCLARERGSKRRSFNLSWGDIYVKSQSFLEKSAYLSIVISDKAVVDAFAAQHSDSAKRLPSLETTEFGVSKHSVRIPLYRFMKANFEVRTKAFIEPAVEGKSGNISMVIHGHAHEAKEARNSRIMSMRPQDLMKLKFEPLPMGDDDDLSEEGSDSDEDAYAYNSPTGKTPKSKGGDKSRQSPQEEAANKELNSTLYPKASLYNLLSPSNTTNDLKEDV